VATKIPASFPAGDGFADVGAARLDLADNLIKPDPGVEGDRQRRGVQDALRREGVSVT
jgi:hypothetical protein